MKVIYHEGSRSSITELDWEARAAVSHAKSMVEGKTGFRTQGGEVWRDCALEIWLGHNIYTTAIEIRPPDRAVLECPNAFNAAAYYANGVFWAYISRNKVELI